MVPIRQWSPTFLAPGTGFVEDNFSTDGGGDDLGGNASNGGESSGGNAIDGERQVKLPSLAHHSHPAVQPVPNRPQTTTGPRPGGWGPLI